MKRLASEYDKELFLTLRYPAVLPQGSSFRWKGFIIIEYYVDALYM